MSSSSQQPPANFSDNNINDQNNNNIEGDSSSKPILALPAPGDVSSSSAGGVPTLEVNGQDIKLDLLGPVVVNEDGTMSRIDNWHEMADIEKANVRRILLKRNESRLTRLRAERDKAIAAEEAAAAADSSNDK
ncbi:hypothetical protein BGZ95_007507 [Linnemannia exigua]|uniref:Uncharacterized protein n=1 Tax=Linnemannia exigua TaxID=604196 RepID=A0AAD4H7U2_9FUNG|nr:hypothetical protein BGZ95_007507 [Linnemannia exigua]